MPHNHKNGSTREVDDNKESSMADKKRSFEERMLLLVTKGKKRGKRNFLIVVVLSLAICGFTVVMGYFLIRQITQISDKVSLLNIKDNFKSVIDPEQRCETSCCLASLEKINKFKYSEPRGQGECPEGFFLKTLQCESSLAWCEKEKEIIKNNLQAADEVNSGSNISPLR